MSKRHGLSPLVGQLKFRYRTLLLCLVLMAVNYFVSQGYLAANIVDLLGMVADDAAEPLTNKEAVALLLKTDWYPFLRDARIVLVLAYGLSFLSFIYKLWDSLPPHRARMSPVKGTLPLLVPLFNGYWLFVSVMRYVKDANTVVRLRNIEDERVSPDIAMGACASLLLSVAVAAPGGLSAMGDIFLFVHMVFMCMFASQAESAAVAIAKTNRSHVPDRQPLMERNAPVSAEKSA